jgi:hypothetical protein
MRPCAVSVTPDLDVCLVHITEGADVRMVATRRASPKRRLRICRIDGSRPAIEIHAPTADLLIVFDAAPDRDRMAAAIE